MINGFYAIPYLAHSLSQLYNINLNTEEYLYDLKMCDRDYQHVTNLIFRNSRLLNAECIPWEYQSIFKMFYKSLIRHNSDNISNLEIISI